MSPQDRTLLCCDCGQTFTFTAREQEVSDPQGTGSEPKRCQECHVRKKMGRYGDGDYNYRSRSWK